MTRRFFSGLFLTASQTLWAGKVATSTQEPMPLPGAFLAPPSSKLYLADDRFMKLLAYLKGRYQAYQPMSLHGDLTCIISEMVAESRRETIDVTCHNDVFPRNLSFPRETCLYLKLGPTSQDAPQVQVDIRLLPGFTITAVNKGVASPKPLQTLVARTRECSYYLDNWQGYITKLEYLR